jgi:uncharacterized paraquat-inducible protein A
MSQAMWLRVLRVIRRYLWLIPCASMILAGLAVSGILHLPPKSPLLPALLLVVAFSFFAGILLLFVAPSLRWSWTGLKLKRENDLVEQRARAGQCTTCGYNLTGNVSGTCPECGTSISRT